MTHNTKTNRSFQAGRFVSFKKTVNESDVNAFAEISGDFSPNHVDKEFMKNSVYGKCIAHGALLVAYMSRASSLILEEYPADNPRTTAVSLGYDRIRFIKPVFINDTINVEYTVVTYDLQSKRSRATIEITNQHNELIAVATHILTWVPNSSE